MKKENNICNECEFYSAVDGYCEKIKKQRRFYDDACEEFKKDEFFVKLEKYFIEEE